MRTILIVPLVNFGDETVLGESVLDEGVIGSNRFWMKVYSTSFDASPLGILINAVDPFIGTSCERLANIAVPCAVFF